jgi:hypothetical protein
MLDWIQANPALTIAMTTAGCGVVAWAYSVHYTLKRICEAVESQNNFDKKMQERMENHEVRLSVLERAA